MPFIIAGAVLLGTAYQANEARKARAAAARNQAAQLQQQEADAAAMRNAIAQQTAAYGQQAASSNRRLRRHARPFRLLSFNIKKTSSRWRTKLARYRPLQTKNAGRPRSQRPQRSEPGREAAGAPYYPRNDSRLSSA